MALTPLPHRARAAIALLAALAACSSGSDRAATDPGRAVLAALVNRPEPTDISLSDQEILDLPGSVLIVRSPQIGTRIGYLARGLNNGAVQWRADDGIGITTRNGQIISTAGFGTDLDSANIPDIVPETAALRDHYHYADTARIERRRFRCRFSEGRPDTVEIAGRRLATTRVDETCTSDDGLQTRNTYQINTGGQIIASRQFVHPDLGYLELQNTQAVK